MWRVVGMGGIGLAVLFVLIQLVPYGRDHTNPPVVQGPAWDSPQTEMLARRACFDCHSNETKWLWYHNIAPISWGVQRDVQEARAHMNFSEWHLEQDNADEAADKVRDGEMPPFLYLLAHPEAKLSAAEKAALIRGLSATFGDDEAEGDAEKGAEEARDEAAEATEEAQEEAAEATEEAQEQAAKATKEALKRRQDR